MTNANGSVHNYEVKVGDESHRFTCTQAEKWGSVGQVMAGYGDDTPAPEIIDHGPVDNTPVVDTDPNAEHFARVESDRAALVAMGVSPGQPYHDLRSGVAGEGKGGRVRRSNTEHDQMLNVPGAVEAFVGVIEQEQRQDILMPTVELAMRGDGSIVGRDDARWAMEPQAMTQLASRVGIEQPAYLEKIWPVLRAQNWNQHRAVALKHEKSTCPEQHPSFKRLAAVAERNTLCRVRRDSDKDVALWAAVGENYGVFDVNRIAQDLAAGMSGYPDARCEIQYDGTRAQMDVLFHSDVRPEHYAAGEVFKVGIRVRSSDAGGGSINVGLLAYQSTCTNMMMVNVGTFNLERIRHIGSSDNLSQRFAAAMGKSQEQIGHFLQKWGYACEESLVNVTTSGDYKPEHLRLLDEMDDNDPLSETDLLTGIFKGIGKTGVVTVGRNDWPGLLAAHARDDSGAVQCSPVTRASVVNAITRYAHEHVGRRDPLRQMELEREAGALLVGGRGGTPQPLPFMPPTRQHVAA